MGTAGYDNQHPDYTPACKEAGGWEGMKSLVDAMHEMGYLFGIHDQYRDYYFAAKTFDKEYAIQLADGSMPQHHMWAGGDADLPLRNPGTVLCKEKLHSSERAWH